MSIETLTRWLVALGGRSDDLEVRERDGGRGVYATRAISEGTVLVHVPRSLLVTREVARTSSVVRQVRDGGVELSGTHAMLAAWLLVEDRTAYSPFRPYLDVLPRDLSSFAVYAPPEERALLRGSLAGAMLRELDAAIDADLPALRRVRLLHDLDRDALVWARSCVASRVFSVQIDGIDTFALAPFADLFDHHAREDARWGYDPSNECFTVTAMRDLAPGDQVHDSYGQKPNARFLVQYGFCLDDNPFDQVELGFPTSFLVSRDPRDDGARELIAWLRKHHPAPDDARAAITAAVDAAFARYDTTEADDDALLAGTTLTARGRDFVRARRGEKRVLARWRDPDHISTIVASISTPER